MMKSLEVDARAETWLVGIRSVSSSPRFLLRRVPRV